MVELLDAFDGLAAHLECIVAQPAQEDLLELLLEVHIGFDPALGPDLDGQLDHGLPHPPELLFAQ